MNREKSTNESEDIFPLLDIFIFSRNQSLLTEVFGDDDQLYFSVISTQCLSGDLSEEDAINHLMERIDPQTLNSALSYIELEMSSRGMRPSQRTTPLQTELDEALNSIAKPPKTIRFALLFFVPKKARENLLGDLDELYIEVCGEFGERAANAWYFKECATSLWPQFKNWLVRVGFFSMLLELWHRFTK